MDLLKTQAIQTALSGNWQEAISLNQSILNENQNDIDALNRLAYAHASIGNTKDAKEIYNKVLTLDKQNPIALRNLKRLSGGNLKKQYNGVMTQLTSNLFIEEPGKTKVIELVNTADKKIIAPLRSGERLQLQVKRLKIFVLDGDKQYIGMFPDDISKRLIDFIQGGNEYEAFVKTVNTNKVTIFARETKRVTRYQFQASFVANDKSKFNLESGKTDPKMKKIHDIDDDDDDVSSGSEEESL